MKLIGSRTEQDFRERLIRSNRSLRERTGPLAAVLETAGVDVANAYVISWIPEQGEDIYDVLTTAGGIVTVELPHDSGEILLARQSLKDYERGCSLQRRIELAVALDLIASTGRVLR
jgi:NADPH-dependent 7-cyano-7-deazaguanine reductase QueF-like protein